MTKSEILERAKHLALWGHISISELKDLLVATDGDVQVWADAHAELLEDNYGAPDFIKDRE